MNGREKMHTKTQDGEGKSFEHAWKIHEYLTSYIQLADTKAGAVIALGSINAAILAVVPEKIDVLSKLLLGSSIVLLVIGLLLAISVIAPRTTNKSSDGFIYWKNIMAFDHYDKYKQAFLAEGLLDDVLKHNYYLAGVAEAKYRRLNVAIGWQYFVQAFFWLAIALIKLL